MPKFEVNVQGAVYDVDAPDETTAWNWANYTHRQEAAKPSQASAPQLLPVPQAAPETGFIPSVKRGFYQTASLLGDVLPAMAARAVGADEYAEKQWKEAAETKKMVEERFPQEVPSFTDIKDVGSAYKYVVESVGENLASILPTIFTGGTAGLLTAGARKAALTAAERVAAEDIAKAMAAGPLQEAAIAQIQKTALDAGIKQARNIALKSDVAGALTGSALQNIPDVYQNIKEKTGKEDLGAALIFGGINAGLDAIMPIHLMQKARKIGVPTDEIGAAFYKRFGKGLVTGFAEEGATEFAQEVSSAAAEKFVDENQQFFTKENLERFINAGLKGGIGGGVITGTTNVLTGKGPQKAAPPPAPETEETAPPAPPEGQAPVAPAPKPPVAPTDTTVAPPPPPPSMADILGASFEGPANVATTDEQSGGAGPTVAGEPGTGTAAPGVGGPDTSGVVSTQPPTGELAGGEGAPTAPVTPAPTPAPAPPALANPVTDDFLNQLGVGATSTLRKQVGKIEMGSLDLVKRLQPLLINKNVSSDVKANIRTYLGSLTQPAPPTAETPAAPSAAPTAPPPSQATGIASAGTETKVGGAPALATFTEEELNDLGNLLGEMTTKPPSLGARRGATLAARTPEDQAKVDKLKGYADKMAIRLGEDEDAQSYIARIQEAFNRVKEQQGQAPFTPITPTTEGTLAPYGARVSPKETEATTEAAPVLQRPEGPSKDERGAEITAKEKSVGENYDKNRDLLVFGDDTETLNFLEEAEKGRFPANYDWGSERLSNLLRRNKIEEPLPSEEYDSKNASEQEAEKAQALQNIVDGLNAKRNIVKNWEKLTRDQKDVYLANLSSDTPAGRQNALEALGRYTTEKRAAGEATPGGDLLSSPAAGIYEQNRSAYNRRHARFGVSYPSWGSLTPAQRELFYRTLRDRVLARRPGLASKSDNTIFENAFAVDHDFAAATLAHRLAFDKAQRETETARKSAETRAAIESAEQPKEEPPVELGWKEAPETERVAGEGSPIERLFKSLAEKFRPKEIPDHVIAQIKKGNMKAVMQYLRTASPNKLYRVIAQRVYEVGVNSKIEFVNSLPDNRIAEYDATTDTIRVTAEGLTDKYLLHEIVHATTVKVVDAYLAGRIKELTPQQLDAVRHLEDLMEEARNLKVQRVVEGRVKPEFITMQKAHPNAFEDLYEFVSYAITDEALQSDLEKLNWSYGKQKRKIGGKEVTVSTITKATAPLESLVYDTILPEKRSLWTEFTNTVSKILGFTQKIFARGGIKGSNALIESFAAFESILSPSQGGFESLAVRPSLAAKAPAPAPKPAEKIKIRSAEEITDSHPLGDRTPSTKSFKEIFNKTFPFLVRKFQNAAAPIKTVQEFYEKLGKITHIGPNINNVWSQITKSSGRAWMIYVSHMMGPATKLNKAIEDFAKSAGLDVKKALQVLHSYAVMLHEPERRMVRYLKTVPLNDMDEMITLPNNKKVTPDGFRKMILARLADDSTTPAQAVQLRQVLEKIALPQAGQATSKYWAKEVGSPKNRKPTTPEMFDIENLNRYNVAGLHGIEELHNLQKMFGSGKYDKARLDAVMSALREVHAATEKLDKEANYRGKGVDNVIAFYGYKNYVPFKGKPGKMKSLQDEEQDLDPFASRRVGADLNDRAFNFNGRQTDSENPFLQSLADGSRAALRVGRKELTLAIKNAVNQKILHGDAKTKITFADRYLDSDALKEAEGETKVLHYEPDGTITVIKLTDKAQREAIRRTYREINPLVDKMNAMTSLVGQTHTRYNIPFAPMNFVRDALTNAFSLGAEFGPVKSGQLLGEVARAVAEGGFHKSVQIAHYLGKGDMARVKAMANADKTGFTKDLLDYLQRGGRVSYLQGLAARSQLDEVVKEAGRSGIIKTKDGVDKFFDSWTEMFEFTSRAASYRVLKQSFTEENLKKGMPKAQAEEDAAERATEYAKNLANFEQVGEWGKGMGALFMFFRPAATGAVRAIESLRPAFGFDEIKFRARADGKATKAEIDSAVVAEMKKVESARAMVGGLLGMGACIYIMSYMMSGDDDQGRNKVATDDPARWTRYARFFVPGMEHPLQIPWGFGLGSFASAGAQVMSGVLGNSSTKEVLGNIVGLGLDNFFPVPISRMNPLDNFPAWVMDTSMPSLFRPFLEYVMNVDSLGREIYNNRQSRVGDAYTGGDSIPEIYKMAARTMFDATLGGVDVSPNTLYFWASNYADGLAKFASTATDLGMVAAGMKDFNPKTDTVFFDSFFGAPSNFDAKQFSSLEGQIKALEQRLNTLKQDPSRYAEYVSKNPTAQYLVDYYNNQVNGTLKQTRQMMNDIRANRQYNPKERDGMINNIKPIQNLVKRNFINTVEQISELKP